MPSAWARIDSMSRERPSMKLCRSLAAWYSAFSFRSPWARASSMSSTFLGRSTSRNRLSSSRRACCPRGVIGNLGMTTLPSLVFLQRAHLHLAGAQLGDGAHRGARRRQRRVIRNRLEERVAANREGVLDRRGARGGVDDQVDSTVEDAVHAVRAPLAHLVDALYRNAVFAQPLVRSDRRQQLEAEIDQPLGDRDRAGLVALLHGKKNAA